MKNLFCFILIFFTLFGASSLVVHAEGSWYDEWLDTYDERNPDNNTNYDNFKKDLMYYEGIVINSNNESQFMTSFANYVVTNVDDGSFYLTAIQSGVNAYKNGSLSAKGFVTFLNDVCSYSGINYQSLLKETASDLNKDKGYFLIPTLSLSRLNSVYLYNDEYSNFIRGYMADKNLTFVSINKSDNNTQWVSSSVDLSSNYNFVLYNSQLTLAEIESFYRDVVAQSNVYNTVVVGNFYLNNGTSTNVRIDSFNGSSFSQVYFQYGMCYPRWYCLVNTNDSYSFVPLFKNVSALTNYLAGNSSFYSNPLLKDLDLPDDFDYSRLQQIIDNSIHNGDWINSIDLQKIINVCVTDYLESININTRDILLSIQLGLIDNINNEPYLKQIRDLQIINNEKLDILIELIRNGGIGSGGSGSINLDEVSERLDTIISILNKHNLPYIDVDSPDLTDFTDLLMDKFPFSIPYDIYLIVQILGVEPVKPDMHIGFPIMGSEQVFLTSVDLSWFDSIQPLLFWFIDLGYAIFLLMLSFKIIEGVRR